MIVGILHQTSKRKLSKHSNNIWNQILRNINAFLEIRDMQNTHWNTDKWMVQVIHVYELLGGDETD